MNFIKTNNLFNAPTLKPSFKRHYRIFISCSVLIMLFLFMSFQAAGNILIQDELVRPESDGSLRLTAEKGKPIGPEIKYMPEWKAFGWFTSADRVEWNVEINKSGKYDAFLEWSVSDKEAGKPFVFIAGAKQLKNKVDKTGSWETFKTKKIGRIHLTAGNQKMVFKPDSEFEDGALLDLREIKLVPVFDQKSGQKSSSGSIFKTAVVKINITPQDSQNLLGYGARKSTGTHDPIFHKIIALDDGTTQFFLISSDICLISPSEYDHVAAKLQSLYGIDPVNVWWTVTHTHSAPEVGPPGMYATYLGERVKHQFDKPYTEMVERTLIEGIREAREKLEPARFGVGWGFSQANINRRAVDVDGNASIGLNPDGPVDRRIGLIRIDKADGSPMALIANYAIHGTVLGPQFVEISGDAPGIVAQYVEEKTGVPLLFINGAAGNMAPIYSVYPNPRAGHLGQFRVLLGDKILDANKKLLSTTKEVKLTSGAITVETPRKAGLGWPEELPDYTTTAHDGTNIVRLPIRFLKINDEVAIWSAPLELFCEISNEIRDRSPFPYTFYYGYSNGWLGYLPAEEEFPYGGYEVEKVSPFTSAAPKDVTESVLGYLQGEMGRKGL